MNLKSTIGTLRLFALCEGISYLLFAVTMPLKYMLNFPEPNYIVGMLHGFLFVGYIALVCINAYQHKWNLLTLFYSFLASIIPFGTFVADHKIFKPLQHTLKL